MEDKWRNGGKKVETSVRNRNDGRMREGDEREREHSNDKKKRMKMRKCRGIQEEPKMIE